MAGLSRWVLLPAALLMLGAVDPDMPAPRLHAPGWMQRHQDKLQEIHQGRVDMIFLGDSITQELENTNPAWGDINEVWQRYYGCRHAVNLGFNGDSTSSILWRIENGEVAGIQPRLAVLMVGTNNIRPAIQSSAAGTAGAIGVLVAELHRRLPGTHILLLGIPPSGRAPAVEQERMAVNAALAGRNWAADNARFVDVDAVFMAGGTLDTSLFRQGTIGRGVVHPNAQGWGKLAASIEPDVRGVLGACGR